MRGLVPSQEWSLPEPRGDSPPGCRSPVGSGRGPPMSRYPLGSGRGPPGSGSPIDSGRGPQGADPLSALTFDSNSASDSSSDVLTRC